MDAIKIIKKIMDEKGIKQGELSKMVDESRQITSFRLKNAKDIKVDTFIKYLDCLGYEITIKEKTL